MYTICRDMGRFPSEAFARGSEEWEVIPRRSWIRWLFGSFTVKDRRRAITAKEYDELVAVYMIEGDERKDAMIQE